MAGLIRKEASVSGKSAFQDTVRPYFHLKNLTVGYDGHPLIHDIDICVQKGQIITLIGPNGAGKSTILKSITRQLKLIAGSVMFDGQDIADLTYRQLASRMAVVLTDRMKPELMTCHDVVATGRYPYTDRLGLLSREDEEKVDAAMCAVHAQEIGVRDFNSISDGQRQRVLLARAICQEPDVLVLDEPTSFLDVRYKLELLSILRAMAKEKGITVIMSLHEIDLAMKVADKIACIKGDTILRYGTPDEIFEETLIRDLYDIEDGFFDPLFGSIEMPRPQGDPKTLVLSSCGTGVGIYRRLQKENEPFIAGILYTNDVDYRLARLLASQVICADPFEPVPDACVQQALDAVRHCERVIDAGVRVGTYNAGVARVIEAARHAGKLQKACSGTSMESSAGTVWV